jgi:import inner membrane translocase subunit TIM44
VHSPDAYAASSSSSSSKAAEEEVAFDPNSAAALDVVRKKRSAWEVLADRLRSAPIIESILGEARRFSESDTGKKAKAAVQDRVEDAREYWETSQNPMIYKISSLWDTMTAETEKGIALKELRRLDPSFTEEEWTHDVTEHFIPAFLTAFLRNDLDFLKEFSGEVLFNKLKMEIEQRKKDGLSFSPHILDVEQAQVLTMKFEEGMPSSTIVLHCMVQQINCVYGPRSAKQRYEQMKKAAAAEAGGEEEGGGDSGESSFAKEEAEDFMDGDGDELVILEGGEEEIRANFYLLAFQRIYDEDEQELRWIAVDLYLGENVPYV